MCQYIRETLHLSDAAAERLDAQNSTYSLRLIAAAKGQRMPKRNDGVDFSLPMHVGDGAMLITREKQLVALVDQSGTYQAPWVRHIDDLDEIPDGLPWGENARQIARAFKRRSPTE